MPNPAFVAAVTISSVGEVEVAAEGMTVRNVNGIRIVPTIMAPTIPGAVADDYSKLSLSIQLAMLKDALAAVEAAIEKADLEIAVVPAEQLGLFGHKPGGEKA